MTFLLIQMCFLSISWTEVESVVELSSLTLVDYAVPPDADFYEADLYKLMKNPEAATLVLRMATCSGLHMDGKDYMPSLIGFQHVVAVAVNSSGELVTTEAKAALPCPPHCGGHKRTSTLGDYLLKH